MVTKPYFSRRFGLANRTTEIIVREDAPADFRAGVLYIAREAGLWPSALRDIVCATLRELADENNWSPYPNVWNEVQGLVLHCEWYSVYDIVEAIYADLEQRIPDKAQYFGDEINQQLREKGIGWQLIDGHIQVRGAEAFESAVNTAVNVLESSGRTTASSEIRAALKDLSARPEPDKSGAVRHAMASLECVARDACGDEKATLGEILKRHPDILPKPLDEAMGKVWGYTCEKARHVKEGQVLSAEEAELTVGLAASAATYLCKKVAGGVR